MWFVYDTVGHRFRRHHVNREENDRVRYPQRDLDYHSTGQGELYHNRTKADPDRQLIGLGDRSTTCSPRSLPVMPHSMCSLMSGVKRIREPPASTVTKKWPSRLSSSLPARASLDLASQTRPNPQSSADQQSVLAARRASTIPKRRWRPSSPVHPRVSTT